jgi:hypothetical protein
VCIEAVVVFRRSDMPRDLRRKIGGADRDRTDDLKLAKLPLSQLSYGPDFGFGSDGGPGTS